MKFGIRTVQWALLGMGVSALVGCTTVDTPTVQAKLTGKSIAVVSTVGETVDLSWRGTTLFNDEVGQASVPDWGLRARLEERTVALLESSGRFANVQRAQVSATRREDALKQLKELKAGASHVLLITPHESGDSIFGTKMGFAGIGVAQRSFASVMTKSAAHVSLRADLMEMGVFQTSLAQGTSANAQLVPAPALLSGPRLNPEYTPASRAALQVQVDAVVQSLMTQMGLDQPLVTGVGKVPVVAGSARGAEVSQGAQASAVSDLGSQPSVALVPLNTVK